MSHVSLQPTAIDILDLAGELRNKIYELVLLVELPVDPWSWPERTRNITPGLLRVNKTIHDEARSILYGRNRFNFATATSEEIASFLTNIGEANAGCIRHIVIRFPQFFSLEPPEVMLENDSTAILMAIQRSCINLSTLTTSLASTSAMELKFDDQDNLQVVKQALSMVDDHFQAMRSVTQVVLEVYEDGPSICVRSIMASRGWKICVIEQSFEDDIWARGFSDIDDDAFDYEPTSDDEYDVDNDSDFWRRAAD
ncbi:hypothetical protein CcaCcLH18_10942 [Colletotrichum camelliae]|nr:hypothetical protein CcaCcLH18_10942 [Colletotrichum camelliae]